jgi:hypothetical protein
MLRIAPVKDGLGHELALLTELSLDPCNRKQRRPQFCYGHLPGVLLLACLMLRNRTKSAALAFVAASAPL